MKQISEETKKAVLAEKGLGTGFIRGFKRMKGYVVEGEIRGTNSDELKRRQEVAHKYGLTLVQVGRIIREGI